MMEKDNLKSILLQREIPEPSQNFDRQIMDNIYKAASRRKTEKKYLKLMRFYFAAGVVLGMLLTTTSLNIEISIGEQVYEIDKIIFLIPIIVTLLFLFEKIYKATLYDKRKYKEINQQDFL